MSSASRQRVQIVEIDQDFCALSYGVAPCTAAVGITGADKCFNTRRTCQDPDNYDRSSLTLRFIRELDPLPSDHYYIPSLVSVSTSPTVINEASNNVDQKALGVRATVTAVFRDLPHSDRVVDPYRTERSYNPIERSTFWAKWRRRNPFYQGRPIRVREGFAGDSIDDMSSRYYIIDSITGPDSKGRVTIKGKDILALADDEKAQAPLVSSGELIEDEPAIDTTIRITGADVSEYPAPGMVRIGSELIRYTGVTTISGTEINITGCTRGVEGTEAADHGAEDRVQLCLEYDTQNCVDVTRDLLTTYAGVSSAFIPDADWDQERDVWLPQFSVSAIITEPTPVKQLIGELSNDCLFSIWWDERDQQIKLKSVRPVIKVPIRLDSERNIIADSFSIKDKPKERLSRVWVFSQQLDPTEDLDEEKNYRTIRIRAALEEEGDDKHGRKAVRKVYSRWLINQAQTGSLAAKLLARFKETPIYATMSMHGKDRSVWTGDIVDIDHPSLVDDFGEEITTRFQVISAEESQSGHVLKYSLQRFVFVGRFAFIMNESAPNFSSATEEQKESGCFIANSIGLMPDGSDGYEIQ